MTARSAFLTRASTHRNGSTAGALAAAAWLSSRALTARGLLRWHVEVALDVVDHPAPPKFDDHVATRFHVDIFSEEWGFFFCHAGRASWIRVTDIPFVHGRDDFGLLTATPTLKDIGSLVQRLEAQHAIRFRRDLALIRTNLPLAETAIRNWVMAF